MGRAPAEAALFELVRDGAGEVREVWHIDAEGRRSVARRTVHGLRREAGTAGEMRLTLLDSSGQPVGRPLAGYSALGTQWAAPKRRISTRRENRRPGRRAARAGDGLRRGRGLRGAGLDAEGRPMQGAMAAPPL